MKSNSESVYIMYLRKDTNNQYECLLEDNANAIHGIEDLSIVDTSLISPKNKNKPSLDDDSWCVLWLYFHKEDDFDRTKIGNTDYPFGQHLLVQGNDINFETKDEKRRYPILHIADVKSAKDNGPDQSVFLRFYNIMDSSIWNYLVRDIEEQEDNELCFDKAVKSIYENYQKGLYDLLISLEYTDLNARICKESSLVNLGEGHSDGVSPFIFHSEHFVKKQLIKKEFEDVRPTIRQIINRKWRILLVDDRAVVGMKSIRERIVRSEFSSIPWNCKLNIIIRLLKNQFKDVEDANIDYRMCGEKKIIPNDTNILIEFASSLNEAYEALKSKKYDIILLDYLFRKENEKNRYGYELLEYIYKQILLEEQAFDFMSKKNSFEHILKSPKCEEILRLTYMLRKENFFFETNENKSLTNIYVKLCDKEEKDIDTIRNELSSISKEEKNIIAIKITEILQLLSNKENNDFSYKENVKIGPMGRFFIVFTSAYSSAVHDRLLAEGLNQSEKYWYISLGACPTNTPQLFLYNLTKMMEKRMDDSHITELSVDGIIKTLGKIYNQEGRIRKNAGEHYTDIQSYQYYYRTILKDYKVLHNNDSIFDTEGSVLMTDFMNQNINLGGLLEHMAQLVHLTAFGTVRQWPEMWEEFIYFKSQISSQITGDSKEFNVLCSNIENYINSLKSSTL